MSEMMHWSSFIKTIFALVAKKNATDGLKLLHRAGLCSNFKPLVAFFFATNAKMVLINDDQCIISDIVLALWVSIKNLNHPSVYLLSGTRYFSRDLTFENFMGRHDILTNFWQLQKLLSKNFSCHSTKKTMDPTYEQKKFSF